jgi:hypothetical protein
MALAPPHLSVGLCSYLVGRHSGNAVNLKMHKCILKLLSESEKADDPYISEPDLV